jgi:hypothetical protein
LYPSTPPPALTSSKYARAPWTFAATERSPVLSPTTPTLIVPLNEWVLAVDELVLDVPPDDALAEVLDELLEDPHPAPTAATARAASHHLICLTNRFTLTLPS